MNGLSVMDTVSATTIHATQIEVNMDKINMNLNGMVALIRPMVQAQVHDCTETLKCLLDQYKAVYFETETLWSSLPDDVRQNKETWFTAETKNASQFINIFAQWLSCEEELSTDEEDHEDVDVSEFEFLDELQHRSDSDLKRNVDKQHQVSHVSKLIVNEDAVSILEAADPETQTCSDPLIMCVRTDACASIHIVCDHTGAGCREEYDTGAGSCDGLNGDIPGLLVIVGGHKEACKQVHISRHCDCSAFF